MKSTITPTHLIDADATTRRLRARGLPVTRAVPIYVRHKPGETTIVTYRFDLPDGAQTWGYAHWCVRSERADQIHNKAATLRPRRSPLGAGLDRLDAHTVLYYLPNDARLRRLRWYTDPRKLKRSLASLVGPNDRVRRQTTTVNVLRYKPERRIVNHISLGTANSGPRSLLLRYSAKPHAGRLHAAADHLRRHRVVAPAPVARLENDRVSIDEFIVGDQLLDCIESGNADSRSFASALADFHDAPPLGTEHRDTETELVRARLGLRGLAAWHPELADLGDCIDTLLVRTAPAQTSAAVMLHGDLHPKNVLVRRDGVVAFVDLERVAIGPAAVDLGCLCAHALAHPIRRRTATTKSRNFAYETIDRYHSHRGSISAAELAWHTAIGLVDQALLVARHLEPSWRTICRQLLETAADEFARSGSTR